MIFSDLVFMLFIVSFNVGWCFSWPGQVGNCAEALDLMISVTCPGLTVSAKGQIEVSRSDVPT
jgi:hypothetical protein